MKTAIIVPTIRENCIKKFLKRWYGEFRDSRIYVIEDNPEKTFKLPKWVDHYSHKDIERDLGKKAWIIPRKTDCVRSYGFWRAYKDGAEVIYTLDDDCYPTEQSFIQEHLSNLTMQTEWFNTLDGVKPRGMPKDLFADNSVKLSVGFWSNIPDLDGETQLENPKYRTRLRDYSVPIPQKMFYPMCGMNLAFRREITPIMYFLLMGINKYHFDRYGDIWAGIFTKKILDHLNKWVVFGKPTVEHIRASNPKANIIKEQDGKDLNEILWCVVNGIELKSDNYVDCYKELAEKLQFTTLPYFAKLKEAMNIWASLF